MRVFVSGGVDVVGPLFAISCNILEFFKVILSIFGELIEGLTKLTKIGPNYR